MKIKFKKKIILTIKIIILLNLNGCINQNENGYNKKRAKDEFIMDKINTEIEYERLKDKKIDKNEVTERIERSKKRKSHEFPNKWTGL